MSKYKMPYHYVEYCDESSQYHKHVSDLLQWLISIRVGAGSKVHEVGCGEGLILRILENHGFRTIGNDVDEEAVRMGRLLGNNVYEYGDANDRVSKGTDIFLFSDSLEHIEKWREHLEWAKSGNFVVIAVPDRHDAHGLRDFKIDSFDEIFKDWKCVHRATRHARHLLIFKR